MRSGREARDLTDFDRTAEPKAFELVTTFDAVHDQARTLTVGPGIRRLLVPGRRLPGARHQKASHVHDNRDHPFGPLLYTISCLHCMTVSLAQGGEGLGAMC